VRLPVARRSTALNLIFTGGKIFSLPPLHRPCHANGIAANCCTGDYWSKAKGQASDSPWSVILRSAIRPLSVVLQAGEQE
jgi:hypothetical protein